MEGDQNEIKGKQFELSLPPLRIAMTCDLVQPTNRIPLSSGYLWNLTAHAAHTKAHNQLFLFYFVPNPSSAQWRKYNSKAWRKSLGGGGLERVRLLAEISGLCIFFAAQSRFPTVPKVTGTRLAAGSTWFPSTHSLSILTLMCRITRLFGSWIMRMLPHTPAC